SRSTSFEVRYSRSRRSALRGRRGVTVRFTMVKGSRAVRGFFIGKALSVAETFRIKALLRRVVLGHHNVARGVTKYWIGTAASFRLDVGPPDHLRPLFLVICDEFSELGRRAGTHHAAKIGKPRPHLGIGERRIDFVVELVDDFGRRVPRREKTKPPACLVARQEIGHGRDIPQSLLARRAG